MNLKPDLQLTLAAAQSIVDAAARGHTVATISKIHGGEIATVYEITFIDDARASLVLKVYPDSLHWKMQKEVTVIGLVQDRLSIPAPRVLLADDSKRLLGLNFIVMTKLNGSTLGLGGLEPTLIPEQLHFAYEQIGQLLREFHRIPMDTFGYIGATGILTPHATNHAYLTHQFQRKLAQFTARGGATGLALKIADYVARREQLLYGCRGAVLCHNDLHAGNLLATLANGSVRLSGVLDFEGALAGDPLMDVGKACFYLCEETRRALLQGYGDMERDHWSETLDLYHLYFVLELWCWMAEIGNRKPLDKLTLDLEKHSAA
jgi:aminoglycoside phosphotransferase (APT) family kinase protein